MSQSQVELHARTHAARLAIREFLEWAGSERGALLAEGVKADRDGEARDAETIGLIGTDGLIPVTDSIERLIDKHFGIDPEQLEIERRAVLDEVRGKYEREYGDE